MPAGISPAPLDSAVAAPRDAFERARVQAAGIPRPSKKAELRRIASASGSGESKRSATSENKNFKKSSLDKAGATILRQELTENENDEFMRLEAAFALALGGSLNHVFAVLRLGGSDRT
ncbi:hypothetical protein AXG93_4382s1050 [Marchantia polymorpha subsp. ruderalis]|uniref:Uncharacterized protein n=1 Tax=Marchantia polymorpha subsp. ruderalis TaxID=1480154 RepID=A0A176VM18_MARPO|nr:hypothetical protein AXG93_4382s1050 [Marchantia polymorpha subsp. ruderalis]